MLPPLVPTVMTKNLLIQKLLSSLGCKRMTREGRRVILSLLYNEHNTWKVYTDSLPKLQRLNYAGLYICEGNSKNVPNSSSVFISSPWVRYHLYITVYSDLFI